MGRIKTALVKRTSRQLMSESADSFSPDFGKNKKALSNNTMPSKRMRNMIAGYLARLKKNTKTILSDEQTTSEIKPN